MSKQLRRKISGPIQNIENDPRHHLTGAFLPQTPDSSRPSSPNRPSFKLHNDFYSSKGLWNDIKTLRWMRVPSSSFKLLLIPIVAYCVLFAFGVKSNPFEPMLFISYPVETSSPDDPRYAKGWLDIVFIAYHIIVYSFVRQFTILKIIFPVARKLGIKKQAKLDRFGEQAYSMLYYGGMGFWGIYIMQFLPTWWYKVEYFWIDYPHWDMIPVLKRYYLMHFSYWIQQLLILALKIEKPRKDFNELVAHHFVTLWLIGWSYGINLTLIGNAVFVSMDIPDTFLALSKLCNYLNLERTKIVTFAVFTVIWTYFRHWLNIVILHSVWIHFDLIPETAKFWSPPDGVWMVWWMRYQIFAPILLLQFLNLFWYFFILRIGARAILGQNATDDRSDDEDDGNDEDEEKEE
ncbi:longevity assurance s LAG1 LAC1 [Pyrrhoderma noxium]|uniref:Longevity assurance s LAG1 LAC1 n=1 Tax=Pyrrhoderma noxium TaxID=2282107 RepID=A0A286UMJ3_9AGAM|nr:longevity assurance s LAG1 LAC1 [Pyrrhoderma noxium]